MIALISLFLVVFLSIFITRIATVALVHTGLSVESARFQARSALTGTGFTTTEAEAVINHPVRRRIIMTLMLVGNAGLVTVISSLILTFVGGQSETSIALKLVFLAVGLALLIWMAFSRWFDRHLSRLIDWALRRWVNLDTRDYVSLLHLSGDYRLVELLIQPGDWIEGLRLMDARPRNEGVMVLGVKNAEGAYIGTPSGETVVAAGDTLVLYGRTAALSQLDQRRKGWEGDKAHREAVAQERQLSREEAALAKAVRETPKPPEGPGAAAPGADDDARQ